MLSQQLVNIQCDDDDDIDARYFRNKFRQKMDEDERLEVKLQKIVDNITQWFQEKTDYFRNLDILFDCLNDKIWNYIGSMALLWYYLYFKV